MPRCIQQQNRHSRGMRGRQRGHTRASLPHEPLGHLRGVTSPPRVSGSLLRGFCEPTKGADSAWAFSTSRRDHSLTTPAAGTGRRWARRILQPKSPCSCLASRPHKMSFRGGQDPRAVQSSPGPGRRKAKPAAGAVQRGVLPRRQSQPLCSYKTPVFGSCLLHTCTPRPRGGIKEQPYHPYFQEEKAKRGEGE